MYTLCLAVISHDRPHLLRHMLDSLRHTADNPHIRVIVSDNSTTLADEVKNVCAKYSFVKLIASPGVTQFKNYEQALVESNSKYISFLHDDDFLVLTKVMLEDTLSCLFSADWPTLFRSRSISFSSSLPSFLFAHQGELPKPYSLGAFPFSLPAFPCWVYPCIPELNDVIAQNLGLRPFGKYSDISFVEEMLHRNHYEVCILPYYYFHVQHSESDSASTDYAARLRLLWHTCRHVPPVKLGPFLVNTLRHALALCCQVVINSMRA